MKGYQEAKPASLTFSGYESQFLEIPPADSTHYSPLALHQAKEPPTHTHTPADTILSRQDARYRHAPTHKTTFFNLFIYLTLPYLLLKKHTIVQAHA